MGMTNMKKKKKASVNSIEAVPGLRSAHTDAPIQRNKESDGTKGNGGIRNSREM